jgi:outer membrane protein OmpA-like peptidoglycan-associated protein
VAQHLLQHRLFIPAISFTRLRREHKCRFQQLCPRDFVIVIGRRCGALRSAQIWSDPIIGAGIQPAPRRHMPRVPLHVWLGGVVAVAVIATAAPAGAATPTQVRVIADHPAKVQVSRFMAAGVLGEAPPGTMFDVLHRDGDWYWVAGANGAASSSLNFDDLHFDLNGFSIHADDLEKLRAIANALKADPTLVVNIEGHTCNLGTAAYNLALGTRRANAVKEYLVGAGIAGERLHAVSYGEKQPKYDNSKEETRKLNRRVAVVPDVKDPKDAKDPKGAKDVKP